MPRGSGAAAGATRARLDVIRTNFIEAPSSPEVHIHSDHESVDEAAARVLARLEDLELVPRADEESKVREEVRKRLAALGYI